MEGSDIDAIKLNGDGVRDQASVMLRTWKEQTYEKATDFNLCKALLEEKRQDIALKFFGKDFVATVRDVERSREGDTVLNSAFIWGTMMSVSLTAAKSAKAKGPPQLSSEIERGEKETLEESLSRQSSSPTFGSKSRGKRLLNVSLPLLPESFCGRDDVIRDVIRCIEEDKMPLCWLWGPPGCGTSTVGIAVLHRIRGRQGLSAVAVKASRFSLLQLQELIRSHPRQHCTFLVDGYDDNLERHEKEFLMAIEDLVQELGKEFTVLVTSHKKPLCSIGALRVESIEVNWLGEEEATELLTWHYTGGKKDRISDDSIPKYLKRLALRCDGIPFVLKAVGSAGYAACHSRSDPVRMERSISNSRRVLRLDNALFERFCSYFDPEGEGLEPCFKMCYERLPEELKAFILGLAIISGSFSAEFGGKILGLGQRESDRIMIRLKDRGFITSCQRKRGQGYRIPRYLHQYLMAESQSSAEQCVAAARARYFEKIREVITRISKRLRDKRQGDALKTFTDHRSRILGFLQLPSSILDSKAHDVTMAICKSAYVKNVLLDYVLVDTLRLFCDTSLDRIAAKSDSKSKQDEAYIVIFLAQIVLKQQRYRQGDLKKIDGMLQAVVKEGTLPKEILLQRKIAQAQILMAKGEHFNAVDLLAESKKNKKVNPSALAILGKASYQLGIRSAADSQSEEKFWKIARPHFEEARECFTKCIENLAKNDSLTCLYTMWIGDCCFLMREYREALRVYEELLKEEDSVNWPNMGSDFVSRKRTRVSATYYALGLSHLQLHVRAGGWDSKDLGFCLASLDVSIQGLTAGFPYSCFLSDVVYLAKGIVFLLLALNEQWKKTSSKEPNVQVDVYLSKAVKSFTEISCRNSVLTNERKALLDVANAYKKGRTVSPETKLVSKSARILLELTPSSEKSKVKLLFAKSLLYLDIVEKDRNQRLVTHEKALSYEKAFDSDLDASDDDDEDDDDEDDDDDGDGVPDSSYEHQTAYAASRFDRRKLMKGFVNCFLPSWTNETIQSQFDGTGLGETQTLASELITSSVEWADRTYFGHLGRSCPARAKISSGNYSSPDFTTRKSAKTGPPMIDHS